MPRTSPVKATRGEETRLPFIVVPLRGTAIAAGSDFPASFAAHICLTFIRAMIDRLRNTRKAEEENTCYGAVAPSPRIQVGRERARCSQRWSGLTPSR